MDAGVPGVEGVSNGEDPGYYPVFLSLRGRPALVVGAGEVATRKAITLLQHGAGVLVVAPEGTAEMDALAAGGRLLWERREYRSADLDGVFLAIGSTNVRAVNERVYRDAESRHILCNIVDVPELCSFIVPSILTRGDLRVAVSTGGRSPAFARAVRQWLETLIGPEYGDAVALLGELRPIVRARVPTEGKRAEVFECILRTNMLELLRQGRRQDAKEAALACLSSF